jgi:serine protease
MKFCKAFRIDWNGISRARLRLKCTTAGAKHVSFVTRFRIWTLVAHPFALILAIGMQLNIHKIDQSKELATACYVHLLGVFVYKKSMIFIRLLGFTFGIAAIFMACQTTIPAAPPLSSRAQGFGSADPLYALQRDNYELMNLEQAWAVTQGSPEVKIAVIDNGIAPHSDLRDQWTTGTQDGGLNLVALNWVKTFPDFKDKIFDLLDSEVSRSPDDYNSLPTLRPNSGTYFHGTHVAGIIAAAQGNGGGIGVCPNCRLVPIIISPRDSGVGDGINDSNLTLAVLYVAGYPITLNGITVFGSATPRARIINMSFSGVGPCNPQLAAAIQNARARGVIIVASVGNLNNSKSIKQASDMTPANCPGVISVGSITSTRQVSNFSNLGATLLAPGGDDIANPANDENYFRGFFSCNAQDTGTHAPDGILSTYAAPNQGNCYRYLRGTSMATPMVSGVVGLLLSKEPNLTSDQVTQRLTSTAIPLTGGLLVNAGAALNLTRLAPKTNITLRRIVNPCAPNLTNQECEITKNYTEVLARWPDSDGLVNWVNSGITGQTLRYRFAYSQEAQNLIQTISRACLLRDADQSLLNTWSDYMLNGGGIVGVASAFADAAETHQKGDPCIFTFSPAKTNINFPRYIDPCTTPYDVDLKCEITKNYTEMLSRRPDDAGLQYWLNVGMSGQTLRYQFAYSQEAVNLIQIISKACLLRDTDLALLSTWQNYTLRGGSIASVASFIMTSPEFYQKGSPCTLTSNIM